jgi:DNA-binding response OmpR family regulator
MRVLLVEDDPGVVGFVARGLREQAFAVDVAETGRDALFRAFVHPYDVIVLDVMIPGVAGVQVCQRIRERGLRTRILMLTALDAVEDRIAGLDAGADDYLTKPFDFGEMVARIRALLRRGDRLTRDTISVADVVVDTRAQRVARAGRDLNLTTKEYALLEFLARHAGRVVGRAEISGTCGTATSIPSPTPSRSTSTGCAASWPREAARRSSTPAAAPATCWPGGRRSVVTIRTRLTLWYMGALAVMLVAVCAGTYLFLSHALRSRTDASLLDMAGAFASILEDEAAEYPAMAPTGVAAEAASEFRFTGRRVALYTLDGRVVAASAAPGARTGKEAALPLPGPARMRSGLPGESPTFVTVRASGDEIRAVFRRATLRGVPHVAVAAASLADERALRRRLALALLLTVPAALLLAAAGGHLLARAALAPAGARGRHASHPRAGHRRRDSRGGAPTSSSASTAPTWPAAAEWTGAPAWAFPSRAGSPRRREDRWSWRPRGRKEASSWQASRRRGTESSGCGERTPRQPYVPR